MNERQRTSWGWSWVVWKCTQPRRIMPIRALRKRLSVPVV
jgi:hypothetical protein